MEINGGHQVKGIIRPTGRGRGRGTIHLQLRFWGMEVLLNPQNQSQVLLPLAVYKQ